MFLTAAGHDASGGVIRDELAAAVAGPGITHRPAHQRGPSGTDPVAIASGIVAMMLFLLMAAVQPGHAGDENSHGSEAGPRRRQSSGLAPVSGDLPRGQTPAPQPRIHDRGLKVMHLRLHGIALVCIPWWPPPRPVSSAWRTGFASSLRVSGCDKLHPGMYSRTGESPRQARRPG